MNAADPARLFTPVPATRHRDQKTKWRDDGGPRWFTVREIAERIRRDPRTVLNWLSAYPMVPTRTGVVLINRLKRKAIYVRGDGAHWFDEVVTFNNQWALRNPPRR
jgi:hypothetical protein